MKAFLKKILPRPIRAGLRFLQRKLLESRDYLAFVFCRLGKVLERQWQTIIIFITDHTDVWFGKRDPLVPPQRLSHFIGDGDFREVGEIYFRLLLTLGGVQPADRILDVGCGIGRTAVPLTKYLTTGCYHGFDIVPIGIKWCRRTITPRYRNFRFHLADLHNPYYNPKGRNAAEEYRFPFTNNSFDFVFLISVFTHLQTPAIANYLREISRVLSPGGRCLITYFLLNEESISLIQEGKSSLPFIPGEGGTMITNPTIPEAVIAHPETTIRALYEECGLLFQEPIHYGSWCFRGYGLDLQDVIIATKPYR